MKRVTFSIVNDGRGKLYANIADKAEVVEIDANIWQSRTLTKEN